jgi:hypothetical protein
MATPPTQATAAPRKGSFQAFQGFDPDKFKELFGGNFNFGQFGGGKQFGQFQGGQGQFGGGFPGASQFSGGKQFGQQIGGFAQQPQFGGGFPGFFGGGQQFQPQQPGGIQQFQTTPQSGGGFPGAGQQGPSQQGAGQQGPSPIEGPLSRQALEEGGFLGGQGRVKFDPRTGQLIPAEDRVGPGKFLRKAFDDRSRELAEGPAIQEAQNFQFQDLPPSISAQGGTLEQLGGAAQSLLGSSGQALQQGGQTISQGIQSLLGTRGSVAGQAGVEAQTREQALAELGQLQRQALSPDLDPQQRALFQQRADERRAEINAIQGDIVEEFGRGRAGDLARLSAQGVIDSTTAENVLAERERRTAQDINQLQREAGEISRQELLGERSRIGETAGQFGQLQGLQAAQTGDILAGLLGTEAGIGGQLGELGVGQQGIGAELGQLGISGLGTAGQLGLEARGQEADLQQAELSTRMLGNQLGLQNIQSLLNNLLGRRATRKGLTLQEQLSQQMLGGGGLDWMKFLTSGGAAGGIINLGR